MAIRSVRTKAGRELLEDMPDYEEGRPYRDRVILPAILAIEDEASATLDVDRLERALAFVDLTEGANDDPYTSGQLRSLAESIVLGDRMAQSTSVSDQ